MNRMKNEKATLLQQMQQQYDTLSKGQKKLADYILGHAEEAAFMTAAKLGEAVGVSESTAVRFAARMGFDGYPAMAGELARLLKRKVNVSARMQEAYGGFEKAQLLDEVLEMAMRRIEQTRQMISRDAFREAVQILESARDIYIVGLRNSAPLAQYLYFYLRQVFHHVSLVSSSSEHELLEQMLHVNEEDAVVGISFPRYSLRTLRMLEFANTRKAKVITLTDNIHSPINLYASCTLTAAVDISSVAGSMTAPMGVVDALITALSLQNSAAILMNQQLMERTLSEYQVSGSDEMELMEEGVQLHFPALEETDNI